jgi:putative ABC transport system permease protein
MKIFKRYKYIFKNALISIKRNKGRNLLIGLIVVVISCACAVTLAIRNSANTLIESYKEGTDVEATIGINRESMRGEMKMDKDSTEEDKESTKENMQEIFSSASNITEEEIDSYGDSDYVKSYYYQISVGMDSDDIEAASNTSSDNDKESDMKDNGGPGGKQDFTNVSMSNSDFTIVGYSTIDAMKDFISGKYSITSGEVSDEMDSDSCVINSELATLNNIEVGDTITFVDPDDDDNTIKLTVTGIFEETSDETDSMGMFTNSVNSIITNTSVVNKIIDKNSNINKTITPTFILTSSNVIDKFSEELTKKGLSEYLSVSTNLDEVEASTSTISNVETFATTFLVITLIIGGVVLFVINMINIRERKYEIGVLRTIGMKRSLVSMQFITELIVVSVVGLIMGACVGAFVSVPVANNLLKNEISSSSNQKEEINKNFGGGESKKMERISGVANVQAFDSLDAVVDFKVLVELFGIGIILTIISSSSAVTSIQRFSPLNILKERS